MTRRVEARAPTRIDFAGGTVDLWPLYLLHERPLTVNAAISLQATALVESTDGPGAEIVSRDRGARCRLDASGRPQGSIGPELEFIVRLTQHFLGVGDDRAPLRSGSGGVRVTTDCRAPAGSGLGGSSTLGIALAEALNRFTGRGLDGERLLTLTRSIETQVLRIPTGEQDYHPALHGGALALHYTVEGTKVERLEADLGELRRRTVLAYTGVTRNSGLSNWDVFKRHLDGDGGVRQALQEISDAAQLARTAILEQDWDGVGRAIGLDWKARRRLSPAVSDSRIDALIAAGVTAGAVAGKVCGAGGGGCLVFWTGDVNADAVCRKLEAAGASVLDFDFTPSGVQVTDLQ